MRQHRQIRWLTAALLCACLCLCAPFSAAAEIVGYDGYNCQYIVTEPGEESSYVSYYKVGEDDDEQIPADTLSWTDGGVHGKALLLPGTGEYLSVYQTTVQIPRLSFAGWINWKGSVDGSEEGEFGQRVFTLYSDEDNFFTLCLRMRREAAGEDRYGYTYDIDGLYLEYRLGGEDGVQRICASPVYDGEKHVVPQNEWHHYAAVIDGMELSFYVDGNEWFREELMLGAADLQAIELMLGGGIWGDPTLFALVDDVALFCEPLTSHEIALLAAGADLRMQGATTGTEPYLPTAPSTTVTTAPTTATTAPNALKPYTELHSGLPLWTWIVLAVVAVLFVLSTVLVNVRAYYQRQQTPTAEEEAERHEET